MRKFYFCALFVLLFVSANAQSDRYWVGPTSGGNWTTSANWATTAGGAGGAGAPTSLQNAIFDGFTGTINYDAASITINSLKVINSSDLTLSTPVTTTKTLTINDGLSTNQDLRVDATSKLTLTTATGISAQFAVAPFGALVDGTIILTGGGAHNSNGGRVDAVNATVSSPVEFNGTLELREACSNTAGVNFKFNSGSFYIIKKNGGNVPAGVWHANALIEYRGGQTVTTSNAPTLNGSPGTFGKFLWNVNNQTGTLNLAISSLGVTFNGDFTVSNTNGQMFRMASTLNNLTIKGNLNIQANAPVRMTNSGSAPGSGTSLTVEGNLNITSGTFDLQETVSGGNSLLKLGGNLTVSSGATLTTSATGGSINEIEFNGTSQQTINIGGSITGQTRLKVNNPMGILAASNITMPAATNGRLTLTNGNIDMGSNLLNIQNPSTTALTGGTTSSHIIGRLRRATNTAAVVYLFPVSKSADEVGTIKIYPADAAANEFEVEFFRPNTFPRTGGTDTPPGISGISNYYWDITRPVGSAAADLEFVYGGLTNSGGITSPADVRVLHWNGASPWENLGGTAVHGNIVTVSGVTTFSPFALGSVTQPLPVKLVSFSGYYNGTANLLMWTTSFEQNVAGFYLERSTDGKNFTTVDYISSAASGGNSNGPLQYSYADRGVQGRQYYYRLKQADLDGKYSLSGIVLIKGNKASQLSIIGILPNPVKDRASLLVNTPKMQTLTVEVFTYAGNLALRRQAVVNEGSNTIPLDLGSLSSGAYVVRLSSASGETLTVKIVK